MKKERLKGIVIGMTIMTAFTFTKDTSIAKTLRERIEVTYSNIKIVVDGTRINPKNAKGETVEPFIYKGTTYLPIRALGEALDKQVNWEQDTKTVYVGDTPSTTYSSCGPKEFLERHKPYEGSAFRVIDAGTLQIRQEDFNYNNAIRGYNGRYLVNGNYTKFKGVFLHGDNGEGGGGRNLVIKGDGRVLFDGREYLKSLGYEKGYISRGDKNQPVNFEVDITGVEELEISTNGNYSSFDNVYNIEFIGFDS